MMLVLLKYLYTVKSQIAILEGVACRQPPSHVDFFAIFAIFTRISTLNPSAKIVFATFLYKVGLARIDAGTKFSTFRKIL